MASACRVFCCTIGLSKLLDVEEHGPSISSLTAIRAKCPRMEPVQSSPAAPYRRSRLRTPSSNLLPRKPLSHVHTPGVLTLPRGPTPGSTTSPTSANAEPPVRSLRLAVPVPPSGHDPVIQNESVGRICPQAIPAWQDIAAQYVPAVLTGNLPFDYDAAVSANANASTTVARDPRSSEDCLMLDVLVSRAVFQNKRSGRAGGAPVLVWIHVRFFHASTSDELHD